MHGPHHPHRSIALILAIALSVLMPPPARAQDGAMAIRVATFNIEDLRTHELIEPYSPRARAAAEVLQRLRPTVVLINEITYDEPGGEAFSQIADERDEDGNEIKPRPGQNAERLAALLAIPQAPGLRPLRMKGFTAPSNTGRHSGFDLNRDDQIADRIPVQPAPNPDGSPVNQTPEGRVYGNDCWGFGTFPGQYGMALLVDERLEILEERARTFRLFNWQRMPDALLPVIVDEEANTSPWYEGQAGQLFRLSSKSHWDIPIRLPNGGVVHMLCSHPTPPAFDGKELRNKKRNHDEIRFWADYLDNAAYIVDDNAVFGGLRPNRHFVILGDLNADPDEGNAIGNPIGRFLLSHPEINADFTPEIDPEALTAGIPGMNPNRRADPDDTSVFGLRLDYALPSTTLRVIRSGVWTADPTAPFYDGFPSDHFPVWIDIAVPADD